MAYSVHFPHYTLSIGDKPVVGQPYDHPYACIKAGVNKTQILAVIILHSSVASE